MKTQTMAILILLRASPAMATHAYYKEKCSSASLSFAYLGNYPLGGDYGIAPKSIDIEGYGLGPGVLKAYLPNGAEDQSGSDVIMTETKSTTLSSTKTADCYFNYEKSQTRKVVKIKWLTKEAEAYLKLKKDDVINFACEEEFDTPTQNENCN